MKNMGFDVKNPAVFQLISDLEENENEGIDFEEYLEMMTFRMSGDHSDENIQQLFKMLDVDKSDYISVENLKQISVELGENFEDSEIANIIQHNDLDSDGKLGYQDFYNVMKQKTFLMN